MAIPTFRMEPGAYPQGVTLQPPGTNIGDGVRQGFQKSYSLDNGGSGALVTGLTVLDIVPAASSATLLTSGTTYTGSTMLVPGNGLTASGFSSGAWYVQKNVPGGGKTTLIELDCCRHLIVTCTAGGAAVPVILYGFDNWFRPVTTQLTTATTATFVEFPAGVKWIQGILVGGATTQNISIGTRTRIDLPYYLPTTQYVVQSYWNSLVIASTAFRVGNTTQTITSTESTGSVDLNGLAAVNGTLRLTIFQYPAATQIDTPVIVPEGTPSIAVSDGTSVDGLYGVAPYFQAFPGS